VKISIGSDHGGYTKKSGLIDHLKSQGYRVTDDGAPGPAPSDYPDTAGLVAQRVIKESGTKGILLCGTGIGMSIAANKVAGVRAAVVWNEKTASLAAEHNGANILCLGGRLLSQRKINRLVDLWLKTPFGGGRHKNRLKKIQKLEKSGGILV